MVAETSYRRNKISNTLLLFFFLLHALMAFDFGFVRRNSRATRAIIHVLTVVLCAVHCTVIVYELVVLENEKDFMVAFVWFICSLPQYIYNCLVLTFNDDKSLFNLFENLLDVDDMLGVNCKKYNPTAITIIGCSVIISVRTIDILMYCAYSPSECTMSSELNSMIIAQVVMTDLIHFMVFVMLHAVYCRLKMLNNIIKNCTYRIRDYIMVYKVIVDSLERAKGIIDYLYLMALAYKIPELIATVYLALLNLKEAENIIVDDQFTRSLYTAQVVILLFLPAIAAGFVSAEAERLKFILYEKLIAERDEEQASFLDLFVEYVSARPLRLRMAKVLPLDWTLPILLTDFVISYQIIIVQLTNLY